MDNAPNIDDSIPDGMKQCRICKEIYPATPEFFRKRPVYCCKTCYKKQQEEKHMDTTGKPGTMICSECEREFPFTNEFFRKALGSRYGLTKQCKYCCDKYSAEHRQVHKERRNMLDRQRRQKNREKEREYYRNRYKQNRDEILSKGKTWRDNNPDKIQVIREKWRHSEQGQQYQRTYKQIRRANEAEVDGNCTNQDIQDQLKRQKYRCYYAACGHAKFKKIKGKYQYHIEHTFPLSRVAGENIPANDASYIVLACPSCNLSKGNKFPWEFPEGGRLL